VQTELLRNEHVKELLSLMKADRVDSKELRSVLRYVGAMERQLDAAVVELQAMRRELGDMRIPSERPCRTLLPRWKAKLMRCGNG